MLFRSDVIEVHLELDGYPVPLLDTAGIRDSDDPVEQEGVRRARERAVGADLVLWVVDATAPEAGGVPTLRPVQAGPGARPEADRSSSSAPAEGGPVAVDGPPVWVVRNKADLLPFTEASALASGAAASRFGSATPATAGSRSVPLFTNGIKAPQSGQSYRNEHEFINFDMNSRYIFALSATDGKGVNSLLTELTRFAGQTFGSEPALVSRERQRRLLASTLAALDRALAEGPNGRDDIAAEELRIAATALGRLTGRVDVEDVLDAIFEDFCIGK